MAQDDNGDPNAINLGLYPAAGVLLGLGVGWWLGQSLSWGVWGPLGGAAVGLVAGLYLLIKEGMRISRK